MPKHPEICFELVNQQFDDHWLDDQITGKRLMTTIVEFGKPREIALAADASFLKPRERQVIELTIRGMSNQEIAQSLGINWQTVKNHKYNIADRLRDAGFQVNGDSVSIINCLLQVGEFELQLLGDQ